MKIITSLCLSALICAGVVDNINVETETAKAAADSPARVEQTLLPSFVKNPLIIVIDDSNEIAYELDRRSREITQVDLLTGKRTQVLPLDSAKHPNLLANPADIIIDDRNGRLLVIDNNLDAVVAVALKDGQQTVLSTNPDNQSGTALLATKGLALSDQSTYLYAADTKRDALVKIDLNSGRRTLVSQNRDKELELPKGLVFIDKNNEHLIVSSASMTHLVSVNIASGKRRVM